MEYSAAIKGNELLMHATIWMNLENLHLLCKKNPGTTDHILHDYTYMIYPEKINAYRHKAD
jgi:hypothetical protein